MGGQAEEEEHEAEEPADTAPREGETPAHTASRIATTLANNRSTRKRNAERDRVAADRVKKAAFTPPAAKPGPATGNLATPPAGGPLPKP
jgi:hypothetical protein